MQETRSGKVCAVITTCRRQPHMLLRAVRSVLRQTYGNFELIIVDDSPADFTQRGEVKAAVTNLQDPRITYIQNDRNKGACASRNKGAACTASDYIAFLDDDDEWLPDKLERLIPFFSKDTVGMVCSPAYVRHDELNTTEILNEGKRIPQGSIFYDLLGRNVIGSTSYPVLRRSAFDRVKGFQPDLPALQDWELWLRITQLYETVSVTEPLTVYHFHREDRISAHPSKRTAAFEYIRKKYSRYYAQFPEIRSQFYFLGSDFYKEARLYGKAFIYLFLAVKASPADIKHNRKALRTLLSHIKSNMIKKV